MQMIICTRGGRSQDKHILSQPEEMAKVKIFPKVQVRAQMLQLTN